jgi:hypothetical protein
MGVLEHCRLWLGSTVVKRPERPVHRCRAACCATGTQRSRPDRSCRVSRAILTGCRTVRSWSCRGACTAGHHRLRCGLWPRSGADLLGLAQHGWVVEKRSDRPLHRPPRLPACSRTAACSSTAVRPAMLLCCRIYRYSESAIASREAWRVLTLARAAVLVPVRLTAITAL